MPDLTRATDAQMTAWSARAAHYRREGHSGVAGLLEEMLAALQAERAAAWALVMSHGDFAAADRLLAASAGEATDVPE